MDFRKTLRDGELPQGKSSSVTQYWQVEKGELLLGFVGFDISKRAVRVVELYVARSFRGQGIGGDLIEYVEKRGRNFGKLFTEVLVHEEGAVEWLKGKGYFATSLEKDAFSSRDGIWFRKML